MPGTLSIPQVIDVSVRDGGFLIQHQFNAAKIVEICQAMATTGLEWLELGHGMGVGSRMMGHSGHLDDYELLEAAKEAAPSLKYSVFIQAQEYSLPLLPGLIEFIELGRVGFKESEVQTFEKILKKLKKYDKQAATQLVNADFFSPVQVAAFAKTAADLGSDILYLVDSSGGMTPEGVRLRIEAIRSACKLPIGFHGHNNLGMALPNTLAAWKAGATWLDGSLMAAGREAGNASMEMLIAKIQERGFLPQVNLEKLCEVARHVFLPLYLRPPASSLIDILLAQNKITYPSPETLNLFSNSLHIPLPALVTALKKKSGKEFVVSEAAVKEVIEGFGYNYEEIVTSIRSTVKEGNE